MKEMGGYLELDTYKLPMIHDDAIALNCGRNCLAYLIRKKNIKKIWLPKFLCASVADVCNREGLDISYYGIDRMFRPVLDDTCDWVYIVNYYGQLSNSYINDLTIQYPNIIVDNVQSYFQSPVDGIDTIYTCRKFLGVTDGAFLYSDIQVDDLETDESFERVHFLLGRYERTASEFYEEYAEEEKRVSEWNIKKMSNLTHNLLHGIDYELVKKTRTDNFTYLHEHLKKINKLDLIVPEGAYMYPFYIENGARVRRELQLRKIYIPILWSDVFNICSEDELEFNMANDILPLPVDQRYRIDDMKYMLAIINDILQGG